MEPTFLVHGTYLSSASGKDALALFDLALFWHGRRKFMKRLVLPGAGFRMWLILVAVVATFTGLAFSAGIDSNPFLVAVMVLPLVACFALYSLWPIGLALWVSMRHVCRGQRQAAAAYGLVPVMAVVIALACGWTGFRATEWSTTQIRLWRFSRAIEAARAAGHIVKTADSWVDPGPPTRASFSLPSMFFIGIYVIYAEETDMAWLNDQARGCQAEGRIVTLGENFYRIAGEC